MAERVDSDELIQLVSQRTGVDTDTVEILVEAFLDEIYRVIRRVKASRSRILRVSTYAESGRGGCSSLTLLKNGGQCSAGPRPIEGICNRKSIIPDRSLGQLRYADQPLSDHPSIPVQRGGCFVKL
jgi:hypothetical protein